MLRPIATGQPVTPADPPRARGGGTLESALEGATTSFRRALERVERSDRFVDRATRRIAGGGDLDAGRLLAVQAEVYRASRQAELLSRVVDRVGDTVREVTQIKL